MRTADFDYDLPPELIAQTPLERRDASRLLVLERATGTITHATVDQLPRFLRPGDLLVANNSRVLAARLRTRKADTGGKVELLLLHPLPDGTWESLAKPTKRLRNGNGSSSRVRIFGAEVVGRLDDGLDPTQTRSRAHHQP